MTASGGRASRVSSYSGAANDRPPIRIGKVSPVSTASPPTASTTSCATNVIGPPVSTRAENETKPPGTPTGNEARRTGRPRDSCDSPKSVYWNTQASAKTEHKRLTRNGCTHDFDARKLLALDVANEIAKLDCRSPYRATRINSDPLASPLREIQRPNHVLIVIAVPTRSTQHDAAPKMRRPCAQPLDGFPSGPGHRAFDFRRGRPGRRCSQA
jgi:hypothetical protein